MGAGVLYPDEVGVADADRVLQFVNTVPTATVLAETVGFTEGPTIGRRVADAILARRERGPFATLSELDAVTGVNPQRFTEIVAALSGARPARAAVPGSALGTPGGGPAIRVRPHRSHLWLGQSLGVTLQLVDAEGRGVPGAPLTCLATWGAISRRHRTDRQRGASVALVTEPAGLASIEITPPLVPPLSLPERAALDAELTQLPPNAATPAAASDALAAFAAHYRADGSEALRLAVDRLLAAMPADPAAPHSAWPILPVTLLAVAGGGAADGAIGNADAVAVTTIYLRDWLGGWLAALRDLIERTDRIEPTLRNLPLDLTGPAIARGLLGASRGIAGLERGLAARSLRDTAASAAVARFVSEHAEQLGVEALTDVVRAAGASNAAIARGGFAVFQAIEAVQDVQDSIAGRRTADLSRFDFRVGALEGRVARVEETAVDRDALGALRTDVLAAAADLDRSQGDALRAEIATRADKRETGSRLAAIERGLQSRDANLTDLTARIDERFTQIERQAVTRNDLDTLGEKIGQQLDRGVARLREELLPRIAVKVDKGAFTELKGSVDRLAVNSERVLERLNDTDRRIRDLDRRIGPI